MFRITVDSFFVNFTQTFDINVPIYRRLVRLFHQPIGVLIFMDPVNTFQNNFDHCRRSVACRLVKKIKPHKLTSNVCQVTFSFQI